MPKRNKHMKSIIPPKIIQVVIKFKSNIYKSKTLIKIAYIILSRVFSFFSSPSFTCKLVLPDTPAGQHTRVTHNELVHVLCASLEAFFVEEFCCAVLCCAVLCVHRAQCATPRVPCRIMSDVLLLDLLLVVCLLCGKKKTPRPWRLKKKKDFYDHT